MIGRLALCAALALAACKSESKSESKPSDSTKPSAAADDASAAKPDEPTKPEVTEAQASELFERWLKAQSSGSHRPGPPARSRTSAPNA